VSTIGSWILAVGLFLVAAYLLASLRKAPDAPANPWDARGLEWTTPSPPPVHNFDTTPVVTRGPYDYRPQEVVA